MTITELTQALANVPPPVDRCTRCQGRRQIPVTWQEHRGGGVLVWVHDEYRQCTQCEGTGEAARRVAATVDNQPASE